MDGRTEIKVLVTDGTFRNTLAILRSLGRKGYWVGTTSEVSKIVTLGFYSRYCRKAHVLKSSVKDIDAYAEELLDLVRMNDYPVLVPVGLRSHLAVSKHKREFLEHSNVVVADWDNMQIAYNKERAIDFAERIGLPTPRTRMLDSVDVLDEIETYPVVIKSSDDSGKFVRYCNNREELGKNYESLRSVSATRIIAQEYVRGTGCGFFGLCNRGRVVASFTHRRIKEFPVTGGPSVVAESSFDSQLARYGTMVCEALQWHGPLMAEFKFDSASGEYRLIELNPKLWGSLDLTIEAGLSIPEMIVKLAVGDELGEIGPYKRLRYRWVFPGEFKALMSDFSVRKLVGFLKPANGTKTNLNFSDPLPTLIQVGRGLLEGLALPFSDRRKFPHGRIV